MGIKTNYMVLRGFLRGKKDKPLKEKEVRTVLKLIRESVAAARSCVKEEAELALERGEHAGYTFSLEAGTPRTVVGKVPSFRFEL